MTLIVHDPIQPPAIADPTVHDAEGARRARARHRGGGGPAARAGPTRQADTHMRSITGEQVAAFRMERHHLVNTVGSTLASVCRDVGGIQAQVMSAAELSLWTRRPVDQARGRPGSALAGAASSSRRRACG